METAVTELASNSAWFPKKRAEQQRVLAQLELILASQHFSQSKRSQLLFRYIVDKTLQGQVSILKERTLGVEVFGRTPDYDTNADPIVRMTAGEIRKRIAQYYHEPVHRDELRIDLPSGTYVPQFQLPLLQTDLQVVAAPPEVANEPQPGENPHEESAPTQPLPQTGNTRRTKVRLISMISGALLLALIGVSVFLLRQRASFVDLAWGQVLSGSSPTLISLGQARLHTNPDWNSNQSALSARDHMAAESLTYSEVQALTRIVHLFDEQRVTYKLETGGGTTFADLRQNPAVLLGGLNNPWTLRAQQNLRYRLATDGNGLDWIADARDPDAKKFSVDVKQPYSSLTSDYAIVARFFDPNTQQPTLIVAGLAEDGTKAASEFITNEKLLQDAIGESLRKSKGKNFEVVIGTQVINGISGPPKILAKEIW